MFKRVLLVLFVTGPILTFGKSVTDEQQGPSLKCYQCYSNESWEDCKSEQKAIECPGDSEVCIKTQITKPVKTNGAVGQETTYSKHCDTSEGCSTRECRQLGWSCSTECCNHDLCNSSISLAIRIIFIFNATLACFVFMYQ